ncbi:MAG: multiprotein bridging factor aMBF1 [Desulfurococcaceae archaeon]
MSYYCEICGKEVDLKSAKKVLIEGSILHVCQQCYTRLIKQGKAKEYVESKPAVRQGTGISTKSRPGKPIYREEHEIVEDYAIRIRKAREKLGWTQQVLASKIGESENTIKRIESGRLRPSLEIARKLEKVLNIKLLEPVVDEKIDLKGNETDHLTIGDLIKIKDKRD